MYMSRFEFIWGTWSYYRRIFKWKLSASMYISESMTMCLCVQVNSEADRDIWSAFRQSEFLCSPISKLECPSLLNDPRSKSNCPCCSKEHVCTNVQHLLSVLFYLFIYSFIDLFWNFSQIFLFYFIFTLKGNATARGDQRWAGKRF